MSMDELTIHDHPHLVENRETYCAISEFVEGKREVVVTSKYVDPYQTEEDPTHGPRAYANRLRRTYFTPYTRPYLEVHRAHLSQLLTVTGADSERMAAILADGSGEEEKAEALARRRLWLYLQHGRVATLVEGPTAVAKGADEAREAGERSYQVIYEAREIKNWRRFKRGPRRGQLAEVVLFTGTRTDEDGRVFEILRRYAYVDDGDVYVIQDLESSEGHKPGEKAGTRYRVTTETVGALSRIPVVIWGAGPEETMARDLYSLNRAHLNLSSVRTSVNYNQGFQRAFVAGATPEEIEKVGEGIVNTLREIDAKVHLIPAGDPVATEKEIADIKQHIRRIGLMEHNQLNDDTREVQSAESKAADRRARLDWYHTVLDKQEEIETAIYRLHAEYEGENPEEISVSIARDFGLEDPDSILARDAMTNSLARELGVHEVQKEVLKTRVSEMTVIPGEGQSADERRVELVQLVDQAEKPEPRLPFGFGAPPASTGVLADVE